MSAQLLLRVETGQAVTTLMGVTRVCARKGLKEGIASLTRMIVQTLPV